MTIARPFKRTCRQFADGSYSEGGRSGYIRHPQFAVAPQQYIRAFLLIQKDLHNLFEFIEPADKNLGAYSYRTHELLLRSCVEVEANLRAILLENGYQQTRDLSMRDYRKLEATHRLSSYEVTLPIWNGSKNVRRPFEAWAQGAPLSWYDAYNATKHDRHSAFERATFESVVDAASGLVAILSAQFHTQDFAPSDYLLLNGPSDEREVGIGGYFLVRFPNFPQPERYDFDWQQLANQPDPFANLSFP